MAYDSVVNTLLTLMDGLQEVNNIVVFGMTNRRELMDSALLRPGRFEVQIHIALPDLDGRRAIFAIHTRNMKESGLMASDVDLDLLARSTPRFSGAEIAGVVRNAASFAMARLMDNADGPGAHEGSEVRVCMADIEKALRVAAPAYGFSHEALRTQYIPMGILNCGPAHAKASAVCGNVVWETKLCGKH